MIRNAVISDVTLRYPSAADIRFLSTKPGPLSVAWTCWSTMPHHTTAPGHQDNPAGVPQVMAVAGRPGGADPAALSMLSRGSRARSILYRPWPLDACSPGAAAYCAAKSATHQFYRSLLRLKLSRRHSYY